MAKEDRRTLDEIIAQNVRRLRKERRLSVEDLAKRLHVGKHLVYDMEKPREGRPQRQFAWSELVALCDAMNVILPDLVLPAGSDGLWVYGRLPSGVSFGIAHDRDWLAAQIFGFPMSDDHLKDLRLKSEGRRSQKEEIKRRLTGSMREVIEVLIEEWDWQPNQEEE